MKRLPKKFEETVLIKHGIFWWDDGYVRKLPQKDLMSVPVVPVLDYAISAIGLEAMGLATTGRGVMEGSEEVKYGVMNGKHLILDKDFCGCVFKAINEVYKDD